MPAKPPQSAGLPCSQCDYVNEPERVYCHNCGAKLDRSLLPKAEMEKQEAAHDIHKRIHKMTNPSSGWLWRETKMLFKVAFFSALLALIWDIFQKPEDVPEPSKDPSMRLVSSDMMDALGSPVPKPVFFADDDINQFLKQKLKNPVDTMVPGAQLVHATVKCTPGVLHIFAEESAFGLPLFFCIDYKLEVKGGKFIPTVVGGAFGRVQVDPQLMQYADYAFGSLWTALDREHKQMSKMQNVVVGNGRIDLITKGEAALR
jgi:hypothetical protein